MRSRTSGILAVAVGLVALGAAALVQAYADDVGVVSGRIAKPPVPSAEESGPADAPSVTANDRVTAGTMVIWGRGELTVEFARTVGDVPGVTAATHVRSDTLGLVGTRAATGAPVVDLTDGFRIPVEVAAVDPAAFATVADPGPGREALLDLGPGQALLSDTAAELRGIGVGGELDLLTLPGLQVVGIVPDGVVGRAEVVVHAADAAAAGLDTDGTVFLRHQAAPGTETAQLTRRLQAIVPPDVTARIVDVRAGQPGRRAPLVLSLTQVKERFGEFAFRPRADVREIDVDPAFAAEHIVTVDVPILGTVTCHQDIIEDLRAALRQVVELGLAAEIDPNRYAGCYYPRRISTSGNRLSHHSWGIALDINVDLSLPDLGPAPPEAVIDAFEDHGFRWGGDFLHPDNHHFEWVGQVTAPPPSTGAP